MIGCSRKDEATKISSDNIYTGQSDFLQNLNIVKSRKLFIMQMQFV